MLTNKTLNLFLLHNTVYGLVSGGNMAIVPADAKIIETLHGDFYWLVYYHYNLITAMKW